MRLFFPKEIQYKEDLTRKPKVLRVFCQGRHMRRSLKQPKTYRKAKTSAWDLVLFSGPGGRGGGAEVVGDHV